MAYDETEWVDHSQPSSPSFDTQPKALDTQRITEVSTFVCEFRAVHGEHIEMTSPELVQEAAKRGISDDDLLKVQRFVNAETTLFRAQPRR